MDVQVEIATELGHGYFNSFRNDLTAPFSHQCFFPAFASLGSFSSNRVCQHDAVTMVMEPMVEAEEDTEAVLMVTAAIAGEDTVAAAAMEEEARRTEAVEPTAAAEEEEPTAVAVVEDSVTPAWALVWVTLISPKRN